ncbi:MAG: hypothetical protein ACLFN8_02865 [Candidatus Woesearchaeota archaeon]
MFFKLLVLNKRGMSPLLVTIFLVAFAVALGAMVMSWGSSSSQSRDSSSCSDVSISPQVLLGSELICFNETAGKIKIVLSNSGDVEISSIINRQVGSDFSVEDSSISGSALRPGQVLNTELLLRPGRVRVELIPEISVLNDKVLCPSKALVREEIPKC